jgi:hypothetical protein
VDVVDEAPPPIDLDDRDPLAVLRLQPGIAVDGDFPQLEAELVVCRRDDAPRRRAEVAAGRGVEDELGYG